VKEKFYIFFDIDGVLNSMDGWNEENFPIEMKCLKNFADTVNFFKTKYEVHLIMSSSWRDGFNYEVGKNFPTRSIEIETPLETCHRNTLDEENFVVRTK